jgi:uncharacterized damage-inducible protein DinB
MKLLLLAGLAGAAMYAQGPGGPPNYVNEIKQSYNGIKNNLTRAAEKMPEEYYSFKPSPDVRSFGEEVAHGADIQTLICNMALNMPGAPPNTAATKKTKAELVAALQEANALCDKAYATLTDANASEARPFIRGQRTLIGVLEFNISHHNETYGTMVPYMRMKGVVPPTSDNANQKGGGKKQ